MWMFFIIYKHFWLTFKSDRNIERYLPWKYKPAKRILLCSATITVISPTLPWHSVLIMCFNQFKTVHRSIQECQNRMCAHSRVSFNGRNYSFGKDFEDLLNVLQMSNDYTVKPQVHAIFHRWPPSLPACIIGVAFSPMSHVFINVTPYYR